MVILNIVNPVIEVAETKYADNVAVAALLRAVKVERVLTLTTAEVASAANDAFGGYVRGVKGEDGYYPPSRFEVSAIEFEIMRMGALAKFGAKFECLVAVLKALGEEIE